MTPAPELPVEAVRIEGHLVALKPTCPEAAKLVARLATPEPNSAPEEPP